MNKQDSSRPATLAQMKQVMGEMLGETVRELNQSFLIPLAKGFDGVNRRLDKLEGRVDGLEHKVSDLPTRDEFNHLENQVAQLPTRDEFEELKNNISHLPTKDEFYTEMDKISGNYQTFNQESTIIVGKVSNHEDRIQLIERHLEVSPAS